MSLVAYSALSRCAASSKASRSAPPAPTRSDEKIAIVPLVRPLRRRCSHRDSDAAEVPVPLIWRRVEVGERADDGCAEAAGRQAQLQLRREEEAHRVDL